jgi:hypothetical protein
MVENMDPVKKCQDENPILTSYIGTFFGSVNTVQDYCRNL